MRFLTTILAFSLLACASLAHASQVDMDRAKVLSTPTYADHVATMAQSGKWSDPVTWQGDAPRDGDFLIVPEGMTLTQDIDSPRLWFIDLQGKLIPEGDVTLKYGTMAIGPKGSIDAGTSFDDPYQGQWNHLWLDNGPIDTKWDVAMMSRGILNMGGRHLYGRFVTNRQLTKGNKAGDTKIEFQAPVIGWRVGDEILLPRQDWGPDDDTVKIARIADDGLSLTIDQPLKMDHSIVGFDGGPRPMFAANMSRRGINFESENHAIDRRGHWMDMGMSDIEECGTSVFFGGRTDKSWMRMVTDFPVLDNPRGRYPKHQHQMPLDMMTTYKNCFVYDSPSGGFVLHSSQGMFLDCMAAYCRGAGHVCEVGDERYMFCGWTSIRCGGPWALKPKYDNSVGQGADQDPFAANSDWFRNGDGVHTMGGNGKVCHGIATGCTGAVTMALGLPFKSNTVFQTRYLPPGYTSKLAAVRARFGIQQYEANQGFGNYGGMRVWRMNQGEPAHKEFCGVSTAEGNRLESVLGSDLQYMADWNVKKNVNIKIPGTPVGGAGWSRGAAQDRVNFEDEEVTGFLTGIIPGNGTKEKPALVTGLKAKTEFGLRLITVAGVDPESYLAISKVQMVPNGMKQVPIAYKSPLPVNQHVTVDGVPLK